MTLFERLLFMPFLFDVDDGGGNGGDGKDAGDDGDGKSGAAADGAEDGHDGDDLDFENLDVERAKAAINKKNQENASLRKRLKNAEPLAKKALEAEEAAKDETTRLTEAKDAAAQEAAEAKAENIRLRMAIKYELDEEDLDLLGVGDEEQIEKRAKRLAERSGGQEPDNTTRRPKERLRPGAVPSSEPEETDPAKLAAKVPRPY